MKQPKILPPKIHLINLEWPNTKSFFSEGKLMDSLELIAKMPFVLYTTNVEKKTNSKKQK